MSEESDAPNGSEATRFQLGNSAWKARSSHGRKPIFSDPDQLWEACVEYFQWIDDNPEMTAELVKHQGVGTLHSVPQRRNMSESGLCIFLDISRQGWAEYKAKPDFSDITQKIVDIIRTNKMDGAISGQFNASIVARELGLVDKQEVGNSGSVTIIRRNHDPDRDSE